MDKKDTFFAGSIPELYERYMVPLIFLPYAQDMARRVSERSPGTVLEIAAGTGVLTRQMAALLPQVPILATDLNPAMLEEARKHCQAPNVRWDTVDATSLPFADNSFDVIACQFGAMFFPDKQRAYTEAWRVLQPGGVYLFSVWDNIRFNEFSATINHALAKLFPEDPPRFLPRLPFGYHDVDVIREQLAPAGFGDQVSCDVVSARSRAASAHDTAKAMCEGTPLRNDIEARDPARLQEATAACEAALAEHYGRENLEGGMQAIIFACRKA